MQLKKSFGTLPNTLAQKKEQRVIILYVSNRDNQQALKQQASLKNTFGNVFTLKVSF